jgi:hypothetical protein
MSLSGLARAAWVALPVAFICGGAVAQQVISLPPGVVIVLIPGGMPMPAIPRIVNPPTRIEARQAIEVTSPAALIESIFAQQQAMIDRMMAGMNAIFASTASGMFGAMPDEVQDLGTMPAAGGSFCEQSISVTYNGRGAPVVKASHAGSGCGPGTGVTPLPAETAPPVSHQPKIIQVNEPVPAVQPPVPHHT